MKEEITLTNSENELVEIASILFYKYGITAYHKGTQLIEYKSKLIDVTISRYKDWLMKLCVFEGEN